MESLRRRIVHGLFGTRPRSRIVESALPVVKKPEEDGDLIEQVKRLLEEGKIEEAFTLSQSRYKEEVKDTSEYGRRAVLPGTPSQDGDIF